MGINFPLLLILSTEYGSNAKSAFDILPYVAMFIVQYVFSISNRC